MKKFFFFAPLLVAALCITSCGSDDDEPTPTGTENTGGSSESTDDTTPKKDTTVNWDSIATQATNTLINYFWNSTGYFNNESGVANGDGWNYWPQAHAMDVIIDAYKRTGNTKYSDLFDKWYTGVKHQSGGNYTNNYYDDEEWITLTMLRLYEVTNESKYLDTALLLWEDIKTGWNTTYCNGGVAWTHDQLWSKNACSNAPASLIACRLYAIRHQAEDLEWAKKIYTWTRNKLFNASGGLYDNIDGRTNTTATFTLSYNQGTFLASALLLYQLTTDADEPDRITWLKDARRAANHCVTSCIDTTYNVIRNEGDGDGALFKGIFMRYFIDLINEPDLEENYRTIFINFFNHNAEVLWKYGIFNKRQLFFGPSWTEGPNGSTNLNSQVSGCTMLEMKARYENSLSE